jgi:predicted transcriptional regulator
MTVCTKARIRKAVDELPANTSVEEAMERLYLISKIDRGLAEIKSGQTVSHEEARKKLKKWLK